MARTALLTVLVCIQMLLGSKRTIKQHFPQVQFCEELVANLRETAGNVDALALWNASRLAFFNVHQIPGRVRFTIVAPPSIGNNKRPDA